MEIEQLQKDIKDAEAKVRDILRALDEKYSSTKEMPVRGVSVRRWNGSNELSGPITGVTISVSIC
jgi:hypothetical protein